MRAHTYSRPIAADPQIAAALGCKIVHRSSLASVGTIFSVPGTALDPRPRAGDIVVGWGRKANTRRGVRFAEKHGLDYACLEDGFIGYLGHPSTDRRRLSVMVDSMGVYYDASRPSRLECLLVDSSWCTTGHKDRARRAIERITRSHISKYNHAPSHLPDRLKDAETPCVLVVDQTVGDLSISCGGADASAFGIMLEAALSDNPAHTVILKVHPDVLAGSKAGHFDLKSLPERVLVVAEDIAPQALLACAERVYTVTSQYGFEALMAGKPVVLYGQPFYCGWGLTEDRAGAPERRGEGRDLLTLVAAALIEYPTYLDPYLGGVTDLETVLGYLEAERAMPRLTGRRVFALDFSIWKRTFLAKFCAGADQFRPITPRAFEVIKWQPGDVVLVWGHKSDALVQGLPPEVEVWRAEDGFLRSVGLGSDMKRPSSLVLDRTGIYFDAENPSALEAFLASYTFSEEQRARAEDLAEAIRSARVSKYNVGNSAPLDFKVEAEGRPIVLVPGQVEGDASLTFGSPTIKTNLALLEAVRRDNPGVYIVYKPHPDVVSRNRTGRVSHDELSPLCDTVVMDADIADCLDAVDGVATMTSLTGFEALLRGLTVTTYGQPFYAGWGLTRDQNPCARRARSLSLDELVYGALIAYARYVDWPKGASTSPEAVLASLKGHASSGVAVQGPMGLLGNWLRKISFFLVSLLR